MHDKCLTQDAGLIQMIGGAACPTKYVALTEMSMIHNPALGSVRQKGDLRPILVNAQAHTSLATNE